MHSSGNTWESVWDGVSKYTKPTKEQNTDGTEYIITADFRKYPDILDSIKDHSCYLNGALNGNSLRYAGLSGEKNYRKAAELIKAGNYATDISYVDKLCSLIERWNLTKYDKEEHDMSNSSLVNCVVKVLITVVREHIQSTGSHLIALLDNSLQKESEDALQVRVFRQVVIMELVKMEEYA